MFVCCSCADSGDNSNEIALLSTVKHDSPPLDDVLVAAPSAEPTASTAAEPPRSRSLHVLVVGARGLRDADWGPNGKSDAFVTVEVAGGQGFQTPVIKDSLDPLWEHEGELANVPAGSAIEFTVWDKDTAGKDLLGRAKLLASDYEAKGFDGELTLADAGKGINASLKVKVKLPGRDYPAGPGAHFTMVVEKPAGVPLGIDVDLLDGATLQVTAVNAGPVAAANATRPPQEQLLPGHYIMDVNGAAGNAAEMIARLKEDGRVTLLVRRPQLFPISIAKQAGALGLDLNYAANGIALLILKVNEGPVAKWNEDHKDQEVRRNDRIITVNGVTGNTKALYDAIKGSEQLKLLISRPAPDQWWACR